MNNSSITLCQFRNKEYGWKNFSLKLYTGSKINSINEVYRDNHYMRAFLDNLSLRPSCYVCPTKEGRSHSDITLADLWGIEYIDKEMDDDRGTSLLLVNSKKGFSFISNLDMLRREVCFNDVLPYNPCWSVSVTAHPNRTHFFKNIDKSDRITYLIDHELRPSISLKHRLHILLLGTFRKVIKSIHLRLIYK